MKKTLGILAVLAVAALIAFFALHNPLGRLVKLAVENFVPNMIQAEVHVNKVEISATDGRGALSGLTIGNPAGFRTDHALKAGTIEVAMEPASVARDVVVLHKVLIDAPNIVYESGSEGSNFEAIQHNLEAYIGAGGQDGKAGQGGPGGGTGKRMIIDSFIIRNARINYGGKIEMPLPDIDLRNIGRNSGGATPGQVAMAVIVELNAKLVLALAKTAATGAYGSATVGAGMALKKLFGK